MCHLYIHTNNDTNNKMQQTSEYSPFGTYFGLADVIQNSYKQETTFQSPVLLSTSKSDLNPQAPPFVPSNQQELSRPESANQNSAQIQYKLNMQRERAKMNKEQYSKVRFCVFCQKSGKPIATQNSHTLRDENGCVMCPYLRVTLCPRCGATGDDAHTLKFCPSTQPTIFFT